MVKLSELKTKDLVKVLIYGDAGSGKTCFAAGFPGPVLYLDFDNKISSAARYYAGQQRLAEIDVENLAAGFNANPIMRLQQIVAQLATEQKAGEFKYKTLVLDSITTFSSAALSHIIKSNPGIKRVRSGSDEQPCMQDYGILKREFVRLIPGLLTLDMNVVMLGHVDTMKDEQTGEIVRGVMMDGSFSQQLPIYFEEVYRAFVNEKGEHVAQTKSDTKYKCRSQIPKLPALIPLKYEELTKLRS